MEKLERLLNKFEKEAKNNEKVVKREYMEMDNTINCFVFDKLIDFSELLLISKEYNFIKRLVEKDKIDWDKSGITAKTEIMLATNFNDGLEVKKRYWLYEQLIMLLSIKEKPIKFLVSIIK